MKIKYRITLLFTLLVTMILLVMCLSIYYFSNWNREKDLQRRLRNRGLSTVSLLLKVEGMDIQLLRQIDENMKISLMGKSVVVYDQYNREIYQYKDNDASVEHVPFSLLNKARNDGEYSYKSGERDVIVIPFIKGDKQYLVAAAAYDKDGLEKMSQLKLILLFSFFTGTLLTFLTGLIFSNRLVVPIQKITNEVKEISSQNLSRRIAIQSPRDELNELSSTFNDLLTRLQESFEIQRRFIANASHELSTPLTSISSQLEITLQNQRSAAEYQSILFSVYEDVKNLTRLTRSLLELAKASGTSDGMELTLVRIDELLLKLPAEMHKTSPDYKVELHFDSFPEDEDKLLVFGNTELLHSAIRNIVVNACKYADNHTASVSLHFATDRLTVTVADNGPGISEAERTMVLQPFYRSEKTSDSQGFGLGLSLAYRIIKLHKGELGISNAEPAGTRISVILPIARNFHQL
ncbi:MAG: HAMP domain-containing histidine kinase [Chitinophagaceae bacterium]|nr:HAMP domain-containing histidine kinase [Chitinophagaceae bacterium]